MTDVGIQYGGALYTLAKEENLDGAIYEELTALQASFREAPDFCRLLATPSVTKEERCQILTDSFGGRVHPYVLNFLKILTEKGYIRQFSDCCQAYIQRYYEDRGILPVTAVTAVAMTQAQAQTLKEKLQTITGKQILLESKIDPSVLGGVRLSYDGKRLDGTVSHRLESLRTLLAKTTL